MPLVKGISIVDALTAQTEARSEHAGKSDMPIRDGISVIEHSTHIIDTRAVSHGENHHSYMHNIYM